MTQTFKGSKKFFLKNAVFTLGFVQMRAIKPQGFEVPFRGQHLEGPADRVVARVCEEGQREVGVGVSKLHSLPLYLVLRNAIESISFDSISVLQLRKVGSAKTCLRTFVSPQFGHLHVNN